jgi:hypothetical protein
LSGVRLPAARRSEREDVDDVECAGEKIRVAHEMCLEQVDSSAMQRHHWRVGRLKAVLDIHFQNAVLRGWIPAVRSKEVLHGVVVKTVGSDNASSEREHHAVPSTLSV